MKRFKRLIIVGLLLVLVTGCKDVFTRENEVIDYLSGKHYVEINVTKYGKIELELDADKAPITVTNFMNLVRNKAYDGNRFHRVSHDFVIQAGENIKSDYIKGEFLANGVDNDISHKKGVVSMARAGTQTEGYNTASSQFFIVVEDADYLDNYYAGFGKVIKGIEVVEKINEKVTNTDKDGNVLNEMDMPVIEYIKEIEK